MNKNKIKASALQITYDSFKKQNGDFDAKY